MLPHLHPQHELATQKSPLAGSPALKPAHDIAGTEIDRGKGRARWRGTKIQETILIYENILSEYVTIMILQESQKINTLNRRSPHIYTGIIYEEVLCMKHNIDIIDKVAHIYGIENT